MAAGCSNFQDLRRTRRFSLTACLLVLLLQIEASLCNPVLQGYRPKDVVKGIEDGVFVVPSKRFFFKFAGILEPARARIIACLHHLSKFMC